MFGLKDLMASSVSFDSEDLLPSNSLLLIAWTRSHSIKDYFFMTEGDTFTKIRVEGPKTLTNWTVNLFLSHHFFFIYIYFPEFLWSCGEPLRVHQPHGHGPSADDAGHPGGDSLLTPSLRAAAHTRTWTRDGGAGLRTLLLPVTALCCATNGD